MGERKGKTMLVNARGRIAQLLGDAQRREAGNEELPFRQGSRGEQIGIGLLTPNQAAALEDSYYTQGVVGTRGTGAAIGNATGVTYLATQALIVVANLNPVGGPDIIMDYLDLNVDSVGTAGTFWHLYHAMDVGNRYGSAGTVLTPRNMSGSVAPGVTGAMGGSPVATTATSEVRDIGHNLILNGVGVAFQNLRIKFGATEMSNGGLFVVPGTNVVNACVYAPPVVIHPGFSYVCNEYQTARTAAVVGELFLGLIVR